MRFVLHFQSDGASLTDDPEQEIASILRKTADKITHGELDGMVSDGNGNTIGSFTYNED